MTEQVTEKTASLSSNQCDCLHYIRDHDFDGKSQNMPCAKCKCQDFGHTLNGVVSENIISVEAPIPVLSETPKKTLSTKAVEPFLSEKNAPAMETIKALGEGLKTPNDPRACPKCFQIKTPGCTRKLCHKCYNQQKADKKAATS